MRIPELQLVMHRVWTVVSAGPTFLDVLSLIFFPLPLLFFFLCSMDSFILPRTNVTNLYFSSSVLFLFRALTQFSSPAHSVAILSHTVPRLCHLHLCFHLVWFSGSRFIILVCRECHHLVLLHLYFLESITAFDFASQTHPMAGLILSAFFSCRKGKPICIHIFLAIILHVLVMVGDPYFFFVFNETEQAYHCLGFQPLILSNVCMVLNKFSLPNAKTA